MSRTLKYITLDVFTTQRYLGNPLALVLIPAGQDVETELMQTIAREFNYSETVFLYENDGVGGVTGRGEGGQESSTIQTWRMRIFTTDAELTFAGHPTIGTASHVLSLLKSRSTPSSGHVYARLLCNAGPIEIQSGSSSGLAARAQIPSNYHLHTESPVNKEEVLRIQPGLQAEWIEAIDVVSPVKGMTFMVVKLANLKALAAVAISGIAPKLQLDNAWKDGFVSTAYYVKTGETNGEYQYRTRMIEKVFEDPATGSMSCGLATLLAIEAKSEIVRFAFTQGVEMGRQSDIGVTVTLKNDLQTVQSVELSGNVVKVMEGVIDI